MISRPSILGLALLLTACASPEETSETRLPGRNILGNATLREAMQGTVSFTEHVKPVLEAKCAMCHNSAAQPGRLSLASQAQAVQTGTLGIFIIPGKPDKSRFLTHLGSAHAGVKAMPPVGEALTPEETALLRRWIAQGAPWPAGSAGRLLTTP
ncbi:MAG: hypothetical protein LDL31_03645 [Prosthecobacter sp.]|jgi:uncharacterized membrane protein|nr:hypothetical protein [Prosthecobacter sp.]